MLRDMLRLSPCTKPLAKTIHRSWSSSGMWGPQKTKAQPSSPNSWQTFWRLFHMKHLWTSNYHPQMDGPFKILADPENDAALGGRQRGTRLGPTPTLCRLHHLEDSASIHRVHSLWAPIWAWPQGLVDVNRNLGGATVPLLTPYRIHSGELQQQINKVTLFMREHLQATQAEPSAPAPPQCHMFLACW